MSRRPQNRSTGVNLDSLMDTLTNVVGILMIILILVQINAGEALRKIISELPEISQEEFEQLQEEAETLEDQHEEQEQQIIQAREQAERDSDELEELIPQLAAVETAIEESDVPALGLDELLKRIEEKEKQVSERREKMNEMMAEEQRLRALLEETPAVDPPAPKAVRLPDSRPIPDNAVLQRYVVYDGRVYHFDAEAAMERLLSDFRNARTRLEKERVRQDDGSRRVIYDQERVVQHFEMRNLSLRDVDIQVPYNKRGTRLRMELHPREGGGTSVEQAGDLLSPFRSEIRNYHGTNNVVWFMVLPDQFAEYLQLRELADELGVPVGWEVVNRPIYREWIREFEVHQMEEPPPPPDPTPTPADEPERIDIPRPQQQLD